MRTRLLLAALLLVAAGLLAGCGKKTVSGPAADQPATPDRGQVADVLALEPAVVEDGQFESSDVSSLSGARPGALEAIHPLRFWRTITGVERRFEYAFADTDSTGRPTTVVVTVHKLLTGRFNILTGQPGSDSTLRDTSADIVRKPLADRWVRRILLKRVPGANPAANAWRIVATSGVEVTSRAAQTHIASLRVQAAGTDTTLTDPLHLAFLRRIFRLAPGIPVTLTVTTLKNDDVVVMCMRGRRFRFQNNGDNTYTGEWTVPDPRRGDGPGPGPGPGAPPILHFGVNALSNGTLFDDQAPYDSQAWILPFLVVPDEIADALP
jgi:hypothetical protein